MSRGAIVGRLTPDLPDNKAIAVRADELVSDEAGPFEARVVSSFYHGAYREVWLELDGLQLRAHVQPTVEIGEKLRFNIARVTIVDR